MKISEELYNDKASATIQLKAMRDAYKDILNAIEEFEFKRINHVEGFINNRLDEIEELL